MRREDIVDILDDPLAQELLHSPLLAHLAYNGRDGYPRVIPIGYQWRGGQFIVCTASNAPKVRALQTNPKVALTVDTDTQPPHVLLVRGTASVEIVDGIPAEYFEASKKYIPVEQWQAFEVQVRDLYKQMARITITPDWAKLLDFETRLPIAVEQIVAQRT
ncbi:MAG TPA: pyridoxamine 5'-phosphate oxidase family protein [Candidatus Dormibacteraeota bacterium]